MPCLDCAPRVNSGGTSAGLLCRSFSGIVPLNSELELSRVDSSSSLRSADSAVVETLAMSAIVVGVVE